MISLCNGGSPTAHIVTIGDREYYFSYETCIAFRGKFDCTHREDIGRGCVGIRRNRNYSNTTARHFKALGCADFERVDDETFERIVGELELMTKAERPQCRCPNPKPGLAPWCTRCGKRIR